MKPRTILAVAVAAAALNTVAHGQSPQGRTSAMTWTRSRPTRPTLSPPWICTAPSISATPQAAALSPAMWRRLSRAGGGVNVRVRNVVATCPRVDLQ